MNNTNSENEFVLFFNRGYFGIVLYLTFKVRAKAHSPPTKSRLTGRDFLWSGAGRNFAVDAFDIGQTHRLVAPSGAERIREAPHFSGAFDCFGGSGFICYLKETPASEATSDTVRRFAMM